MRDGKRFRDLKKEGIEIQMPLHLAGLVRERAAAERRSMSELGTELLARGLDIDPSQYGIGDKLVSRA